MANGEHEKSLKQKAAELAEHYSLAIGHVLGGGILFLIILGAVIVGGQWADWLMNGTHEDEWILSAITWTKRGGFVLDGLLFLATGAKAIISVLKG